MTDEDAVVADFYDEQRTDPYMLDQFELDEFQKRGREIRLRLAAIRNPQSREAARAILRGALEGQ